MAQLGANRYGQAGARVPEPRPPLLGRAYE
jgi:hypothetical protein